MYFWSVLKTKGLVAADTWREHVLAIAAMLALHRFKAVFYSYAFDEGDPEAYDSPVGDVIGTYPRAEPFWVGVLAEDRGVEVDDALDGDETRWAADALEALADDQYDAVTEALVDHLGDNEVFAALWTSPRTEARFPVPGRVAYEILNEDVWEKQSAWSWLTSGMARY